MWTHILWWTVLVAATLAGIGNVAGVHVYTGGNVEARNGTEYRLKCTFQSTQPVGKRTTVKWSFRPENGGTEEVVMYYNEQPYPPSRGRFKERVVWSGNIWKKDVSITITDLRFTDNGTFMCSVLNPPDVDLIVGEIRLSVVDKVTYSEMLILGIVIGGATGLVILIVIVMVTVQLCRRRREDLSVEDVEEDLRRDERGYESKDGSVAEQSLILTREEARF
ncbi:myelin protein zero-like protein 2 isoform X2 [Rhinoraja longicauda]